MTGTSVLGVVYKDGVLLAADTLGAAAICAEASVLLTLWCICDRVELPSELSCCARGHHSACGLGL